MPVSF